MGTKHGPLRAPTHPGLVETLDRPKCASGTIATRLYPYHALSLEALNPSLGRARRAETSMVGRVGLSALALPQKGVRTAGMGSLGELG